VAPGSRRSLDLPDLRALSRQLGMTRGPISIAIAAAVIDEFDYGSLRYREFTSRGWDAYAIVVYPANY
jgi:hypothetical protein